MRTGESSPGSWAALAGLHPQWSGDRGLTRSGHSWQTALAAVAGEVAGKRAAALPPHTIGVGSPRDSSLDRTGPPGEIGWIPVPAGETCKSHLVSADSSPVLLSLSRTRADWPVPIPPRVR